MNSKERIEYLVKLAGGRAELARKLGMKYQNINSWYISGKVSMSCVRCLHSVLPWINLNWLIFGEGDIEVCGKEHKELLASFEALSDENDKLGVVLKEKINELKKYSL